MTAPTRSRRPDARTAVMPRVGGRVVGRLLVTALAGFHGWLLWTHASLGKLLEPEVAARWGLAVAVAAAFWWLSRLGLPLLKGRRALVLWLLVILIHGHAAWTGDAWRAPLAVPQGVVDLIPAGVTAAAALTSLLFLIALGLERDGLRLLPRLTDLPTRLAGVPAPVSALRFAPRPPPSI